MMDKVCFHLRDLENKWVLVTGAASGIGNAVCLAFMAAGAKVVAVDMASPFPDSWRFRDYFGIFEADVRDIKTLYEPFHHVKSYDIVVHCAGVAGGCPFETMPETEWERVVDTNLKGTFNVAKMAGEHFIEHDKKGSLIFIGSISGMVANGPEFANAHYCASKGGVHMLARSLAVEWAKHGIRVNVVAPGLTETAMVARGRERNPKALEAFEKRHPLGAAWPVDIVGPILFLASDMSRAVTGHILVADNGYTAC
jgi:NAD(P)-dependent dehydrogenase (short-subunit alcohol dehydrogenase family)